MLRVYCINCIERTQRYKEAKNELEQNGFTKINWIRNKRNKIGGKGCFLSHLDCYIDFLKTNDKYCLIFEDDIKFINKSKNNYKKINYIINNAPENEILLLGYGTVNSYVLPQTPNYIKGSFLTSHSYIIDRSGANKIINYYNDCKDWFHIDILFNVLNLNMIAIKNRMCIQRQSPSDNTWLKGFKLESATNNKNFELKQQKDLSLYKKIVLFSFIFILKIIYKYTKRLNILFINYK